jgi:hypothetical protein
MWSPLMPWWGNLHCHWHKCFRTKKDVTIPNFFTQSPPYCCLFLSAVVLFIYYSIKFHFLLFFIWHSILVFNFVFLDVCEYAIVQFCELHDFTNEKECNSGEVFNEFIVSFKLIKVSQLTVWIILTFYLITMAEYILCTKSFSKG